MQRAEHILENAADADAVRASSPDAANREIDRELEERIRFYATQDKAAISARIAELNREWDVERKLETNAAIVGLTGILLGITVSRKWLVLPTLVSGFLLQHALQGWCPPLPVFRKMGTRTRIEIEQERYALKFLRGDFDPADKRDASNLVRTIQC